MTSPEFEHLLAKDGIRQLKARYCRFIDTKQWVRLRALFAPGAHFDGFGSVPDGTDLETFVNVVSTRLAGAITIHHVHEPEIEIIGPHLARGIWPMMDRVEFLGGRPATGSPLEHGWLGWGCYEEEYERVDGVWLISYIRLTRHRMEDLMPEQSEAMAIRHRPTRDWL